jgi:hypothetical protein
MVAKTTNHEHRVLASWVFGTLLLIFFLYVFLFGPEELPRYKHDILKLIGALLAALFTFFLSGSIGIKDGEVHSALGRLEIRAAGGIAVFLIVLMSWASGDAPIKEQTGPGRAQVPELTGAPTTTALPAESSRAPSGQPHTAESADTAPQPPAGTKAALSLTPLSARTTKAEIRQALGPPTKVDSASSNFGETWYYQPLSKPYLGMKNALYFEFFPTGDSLASVVVVTPYGARLLRDVGLSGVFIDLMGSSVSHLTSRFGRPDEQLHPDSVNFSPQYFIESPEGRPARLRALCDRLGRCEAFAVVWNPRRYTRPDEL